MPMGPRRVGHGGEVLLDSGQQLQLSVDDSSKSVFVLFWKMNYRKPSDIGILKILLHRITTILFVINVGKYFTGSNAIALRNFRYQ